MATSKIPPLRRYGAGDRVYVQAQRIWLILVAFVMSRKPGDTGTIYYGDVAEKMGMDRRAGHTLGRQLGIIARYCIINDIAPLNSIVVAQASGAPGDEVLVRDQRSIKQEQEAVLREDWFSIRVPSTGTLRQVWELD